MRRTVADVLSLSLAVLAAAGCSSMSPRPPQVPGVLKPPPEQELFLEARASGAQIYECVPKAGGAHEWLLRAPEARLTSTTLGRDLGKHYAGPTWEAPDGSRVLGVVLERAPASQPDAVPWLLLGVKATFGQGVLTQTQSIQRVATEGGVAPAEPCTAANARQFARVPYKATYYFYRNR